MKIANFVPPITKAVMSQVMKTLSLDRNRRKQMVKTFFLTFNGILDYQIQKLLKFSMHMHFSTESVFFTIS